MRDSLELVDPRRRERIVRLVTIALGLAIVLGAAIAVAATAADLAAEQSATTLQATPFDDLRTRPESSELSVHLARVRSSSARRIDATVCLERPRGTWSRADLVSAFDVVLWEPTRQQLVARSGVSEQRARLAHIVDGTACVPMLDAELPAAGEYSLDLAWPGDAPGAALSQSRVAARVVTWRSLAPADATSVWLLALAIIACFVGFAWRAPATSAPEPLISSSRALLCVLLPLAVLYVPTVLPLGSAAVPLAAVSNALAIALAVWLVGSESRLESLALTKPRWWVWLVAPLAGVAVGLSSSTLAKLLPGTGESVVERAIALPSGRITTAGLALLAPLAEEVVFRGALFAAARRHGTAVAIAVSAAGFTLAHVPQLGGAYGALLGVAIAGIGFAALRAVTRSAWSPIVAHWTYNALLVALGL